MANKLKYEIGQRLHFSCYSDYTFSVDVLIEGIISLDFAKEYRNILDLLFNSDLGDSKFEDVVANNDKFYLCKILNSTDYNQEIFTSYSDQHIILCDDIINHDESYINDDEFSLNLKITYNAYLTNYTNREIFLNELKDYFNSKNIEVSTYEFGMTEEEKNQQLLNNSAILIGKIKELENCPAIINEIKSINSEELATLYANMISTLQTVIDKYTTLLTEISTNTSSEG